MANNVGYFTFKAPAAASGGGTSPYPVRWAVMGDPGQTFNSSLTAQVKKEASRLWIPLAMPRGAGYWPRLRPTLFTETFPSGARALLHARPLPLPHFSSPSTSAFTLRGAFRAAPSPFLATPM